MNAESIINAIESDKNLLKLDDSSLEQLIESFPYFQSARKLYLRKLKLDKNYKFNAELKKTAAYSSDRVVLFDYISSEESKEKKKEDFKVKEEVSEVEIPEVKSEETNPVSEKKQSIEKEAHQTLEFSKNDFHSFNEWLQLSNLKVIHRKEEEKTPPITEKPEENQKKKNKFELIDKFINKNPKLKPKSRTESANPNIALSSTKENEGWMTETLAQVYVEQKKYSKAIKAYKILGLKYPEKSGFFADRIRAIKKLDGS